MSNVRHVIVRSKDADAAPVAQAMRDVAAAEKMENVFINHIAGDILTLRCAEQDFAKLIGVDGVHSHENGRPLRPVNFKP